MSFYSFKPNPKQLAFEKAKRLFGNDAKVLIEGERPSPLACRSFGIPTGVYHVSCDVNEQHVASAHAKDWRKAYKLLVIEIEKAFEKRLHNVNGV